MTDKGESRADHLTRTSEVYRRMRAEIVPDRAPPSLDLPLQPAAPVSARALPPTPPPVAAALPEETIPQTPNLPPAGPSFLRRMLTRRPDLREVILLALVVIAVLLSR